MIDTDTIRDGRLLAFEAPGFDPDVAHVTIVVLPPADEPMVIGTLDRPWTEECDGCDGLGHLGRRLPPAAGPCDSCWGTGRALFAFDAEAGLLAVFVPPHIAARHVHELDAAAARRTAVVPAGNGSEEVMPHHN